MASEARCLEARRDSEAGEDLAASYATLFRELTSVFRARGLGSEEAADLAQETLVRTFVHLKRHGKTQPDLRPLAHTIARRLYVERGRRTRPRLVELPEAENLADPSPEPIDHVVSVEERQDVRDALASLAPRHRRVVSMWMGGLRPAEIARELGIKRNAADALLHRARRQLAMKLDPSKVTFGVLGVFVLRLRAASRRIVDGVLGLDPSGSLTQAASGLATIGIAAVLMSAAPNTGTHSTLTPEDLDSSTSAVVNVVEESAGRIAGQTSGQRASSSSTDIPAALSEYRLRGSRQMTNPATGKPGRLGIDVVYTPEEQPTLVDDVLEPTVVFGCRARLLACQPR
jgi:RNA polymerase sigma-70 factor (ECF subfamily)